ncbi:hypothetical protein GS19_15685 [Acinetobacter idrijaensis]|uniref:hypothetical protein n=1 Tax=Acinetobacter sp. YH12071 TaxID=2601067 RepID=UPI0005137642|nr:hypothetical protein [Acinetobacter sp. YH12071]KGH49014.1 hypothetical protein GS19_15685 [Acinetobacter idrijaensis]MBK5647182.1 hypothetical protein [Acinetobacter sp.]
MFTVKLIQDGITRVVELSEISIARQGAETWIEDWGLARHWGVDSPDIIENYLTEDSKDANVMSEYTNVVDRAQMKNEEQCIGILHIQERCPLAPAIPDKESSGFGFIKIFIYKGDQLYVTNRYGATVEIVK